MCPHDRTAVYEHACRPFVASRSRSAVTEQPQVDEDRRRGCMKRIRPTQNKRSPRHKIRQGAAPRRNRDNTDNSDLSPACTPKTRAHGPNGRQAHRPWAAGIPWVVGWPYVAATLWAVSIPRPATMGWGCPMACADPRGCGDPMACGDRMHWVVLWSVWGAIWGGVIP